MGSKARYLVSGVRFCERNQTVYVTFFGVDIVSSTPVSAHAASRYREGGRFPQNPYFRAFAQVARIVIDRLRAR